MSNNRHLISPKTPEVRENTAAKPHHTRLCRGRCVEIDLILKGIKQVEGAVRTGAGGEVVWK